MCVCMCVSVFNLRIVLCHTFLSHLHSVLLFAVADLITPRMHFDGFWCASVTQIFWKRYFVYLFDAFSTLFTVLPTCFICCLCFFLRIHVLTFFDMLTLCCFSSLPQSEFELRFIKAILKL